MMLDISQWSLALVDVAVGARFASEVILFGWPFLAAPA